MQVAVGVEFRVDCELEFQFLRRHHGVVLLAALALLLLLLLPALQLLLRLLQAAFVRLLRENLQRVGLRHEVAQRVGHLVGEGEAERVLIDERRVAQPVGYGVASHRRLYKESVGSVEVERLYLGQLLRAVAEEQREAVGLLAFRLEEESVGLHVFERSEHEVVGREAYVSRLLYVLDMQRVEPKRVLSQGVAERGAYGVVRESHLLAFLREHIVAVLVVESVDAVSARRHALYDEVSARVGTRHAQHGHLHEARVAHLGVQAHEYALHRFEVLSRHHGASHFERVDMVARRETVGVVAHRVALVVVGDGVREVDGVRGVGLQRVLQLHADLLARSLYLRLLELRRRHHHLLRRVVELYELVEVDVHLLRLHVSAAVGRCRAYHMRRRLVVPSSVGASHAGARREQRDYTYYI